jgi:hypothetical protein
LSGEVMASSSCCFPAGVSSTFLVNMFLYFCSLDIAL